MLDTLGAERWALETSHSSLGITAGLNTRPAAPCVRVSGTTLTDAEILERLFAPNTERVEEEVSGLIRWLRPEYLKGSVQQNVIFSPDAVRPQ